MESSRKAGKSCGGNATRLRGRGRNVTSGGWEMQGRQVSAGRLEAAEVFTHKTGNKISPQRFRKLKGKKM